MTVNLNNTPQTALPKPNPKPTSKPADDKCPPTTGDKDCEPKTLFVSAELDGVNETGFVGDYLTTGTKALSDAQKALLLEKYSANGLFDANAKLVGSQAKTVGTSWDDKALSGADDMFVAGDPHVGGRGNAYEAVTVKASDKARFVTMFKDGDGHGRGIVANALSEPINKEGNTAFTQYGLTLTDDAGKASQLQIAGGQAKLKGPDGKEITLLPPNGQAVIGDPKDPAAKIYYATLPGKNEPRLVVDYFEKPNAKAVADLVKAGMPKKQAEELRTTTTASFGFRVPDKEAGGTARMPAGTADGKAMLTTKDGVKTYYDVHWNESEKTKFEIACDKPKPPEPPKPPKPPVAAKETAKIWGDPHINNPDDKSGAAWSYNFNEVGIYNILSDGNVSLNASMIKGPGETSVMDKAGLTLGGTKLEITHAGVTANGKELKDGSHDLGSGNTLIKQGNVIDVKTKGEYDFKFDINQPWVMPYMNVTVNTKEDGVDNGNLPTGLLGETFDADTVAETKIDNPVDFYRRVGLFS